MLRLVCLCDCDTRDREDRRNANYHVFPFWCSFAEWHVGNMPPHDEICEQNDTEKWAMLYTRKDGTGHCVVFDETKPTGYLDFQASGQPIPMEADSGEYIDDNGKYFFLFKTKTWSSRID